jgi:hypothetical protein
MNRRQLSQQINALESELNALLPQLPKDKNVQRALELTKEIEKLRGQREHLVKTLQQRGMLL